MGLRWIRNARFAKKSTRPLTLKRSTAVMLAPKKPIKQNKAEKSVLHVPPLAVISGLKRKSEATFVVKARIFLSRFESRI